MRRIRPPVAALVILECGKRISLTPFGVVTGPRRIDGLRVSASQAETQEHQSILPSAFALPTGASTWIDYTLANVGKGL